MTETLPAFPVAGSPRGVAVLSAEREAELFRRMRPPHSAAVMAETRDELIRRNLPLAVSRAKPFLRRFPLVPFDDLVQYAAVAVIEAVDRFTVERGLKFSTYAAHRIRHRVARSVETEWPIVAVPAGVQTRLNRMTAEQFAADDFPDECARAGARVLRFGSHLPIAEEVHEPPAPAGPADADAAAASAAERVGRAVLALTAREAAVLTSRAGLGGAAVLTLQQAGDAMGVSKERVRQIEAVAMEKLTVALSRPHSPRGGLRAAQALEKAGRLGGV